MSFPHLQNEQKTVCALSTKITRETEEENEPDMLLYLIALLVMKTLQIQHQQL